MAFIATNIPYRSTKSFSNIVLDYLDQKPELSNFYAEPPSIEGILKTIETKKKFPVDRNLLADTLKKDYSHLDNIEKQSANIELLRMQNTFTICTAHQPNIFTGHLYFVYKILHAIKLCEELAINMPQHNFIPVYYIGSEDADLDELGEVFIGNEMRRWHTNQSGAVGRMAVDDELIELIDSIEKEIGGLPNADEIMDLVKKCYAQGVKIEDATFLFIHNLFKDYGLLILKPDNRNLKSKFLPTALKELSEQFSSKAVEATLSALPKKYKAQAGGRDINLFYLNEEHRSRIGYDGKQYKIIDQTGTYSFEDLKNNFENNPKLISPNVILRPIFQEMILPNIAFIGGGGELAYWLELKAVFEAVEIPFPVLILRNSFLIVDKKTSSLLKGINLNSTDFFDSDLEIQNKLLIKSQKYQLSLSNEKLEIIESYKEARSAAAAIDASLEQHVWALQEQALKKLERLEKKMVSAARKKEEATQRKITKIKTILFPNNILQERIHNLLPYYAKYGNQFIEEIYRNSGGIEQNFLFTN